MDPGPRGRRLRRRGPRRARRSERESLGKTPSESAAPAPPSAATAPAPLRTPGACDPTTLEKGPAGSAVQYGHLAVEGDSILFVESVTFDATTGAAAGEWLDTADKRTGAAARIARFDGGVQGLARDAAAFYVSVWGDAARQGLGTGWLARVDRATGAATKIADGLSPAWSFTSTDADLLFTAYEDAGMNVSLRALAKSGGGARVVGGGLRTGTAIVTDGTSVYFTALESGVARLMRGTGGAAVELARGASLSSTALALANGTLYYADDAGVLAVRTSGGASTRLAAAPGVIEIWADAAAVHWLTRETRGGDLAVNHDATLSGVRVGGAGAPLVVAQVNAASSLVGDATHLYWVDGHTEIKRVCRPF